MNRVVSSRWAFVAVLALAACKSEPVPEARPIAESGSQAADPGAAPASGVAEPNELLFAGRIEVDSELAEQIPEGATLYLMGRAAGQKAGIPILVKRIHPVEFPVEFSLTGADQMVQGQPIPNAFSLSARLDQDGDAISREAGDLTGVLDSIERGSKEVKIVLAKSLTDAEGKATAPAVVRPD